MKLFIPLDELHPGGQSSHYPKWLTDLYVVKEFIGRAGDVKNDAIRIGYVELKPKAEYPAHSHPAPEIYVQTAGKVEWIVGEQKKIVDQITAIMIPPETSHAMRNITNDPAKFIYFWYAPGGDTSVLTHDATLEKGL